MEKNEFNFDNLRIIDKTGKYNNSLVYLNSTGVGKELRRVDDATYEIIPNDNKNIFVFGTGGNVELLHPESDNVTMITVKNPDKRPSYLTIVSTKENVVVLEGEIESDVKVLGIDTKRKTRYVKVGYTDDNRVITKNLYENHLYSSLKVETALEISGKAPIISGTDIELEKSDKYNTFIVDVSVNEFLNIPTAIQDIKIINPKDRTLIKGVYFEKDKAGSIIRAYITADKDVNKVTVKVNKLISTKDLKGQSHLIYQITLDELSVNPEGTQDVKRLQTIYTDIELYNNIRIIKDQKKLQRIVNSIIDGI